ncbi:hypothetical protein HED63_24955 [Ochrobactrum cytisi]|nr:hypothetical protein [Brucella cytisi]
MNSGDEQALLNTPYSNADYGVKNSPWHEITVGSGTSLSQALGSFWRAQTAGWLFLRYSVLSAEYLHLMI